MPKTFDNKIWGVHEVTPPQSWRPPVESPRQSLLILPGVGTGPQITGQGKVNPMACFLAMALRYSLDEGANADLLEMAVECVSSQGLSTGGLLQSQGQTPVSTSQMGDAIVAALIAAD